MRGRNPTRDSQVDGAPMACAYASDDLRLSEAFFLPIGHRSYAS